MLRDPCSYQTRLHWRPSPPGLKTRSLPPADQGGMKEEFSEGNILHFYITYLMQSTTRHSVEAQHHSRNIGPREHPWVPQPQAHFLSAKTFLITDQEKNKRGLETWWKRSQQHICPCRPQLLPKAFAMPWCNLRTNWEGSSGQGELRVVTHTGDTGDTRACRSHASHGYAAAPSQNLRQGAGAAGQKSTGEQRHFNLWC